MKKDIISKDIIEAIAQDIATYLLHLDISEIEFVQQELLRVEKREADTVLLCKINGEQAILHLEIQNNNDPTMPHRMLRYYNDIRLKYRTRPIHQYVIYIGKDAISMAHKLDEPHLQFEYNLLDMHQIDCETLLKIDNPDALVLAVLCDFKGQDEKEVLAYIIQRLKHLTGENNHQHGHYMLMLETLSENRELKHTLEEVETMLRETSLQDLPSYNIGHKFGKLEGMLEGKIEGKLEGKLETIIEMMAFVDMPIEELAKKLNVPVDVVLNHLNKIKNNQHIH